MTYSKPLTFGELKIGEKFIAFPIDGDDAGHGGYRGALHVFCKSEQARGSHYTVTAVRLVDGVLVFMPDPMLVLRVTL